ncbi:MAG TPA: DUF1501 domain-containing protein [Gemmataceae bacterium]|nr:DUF1501 domain-containing protein [Gemmataceae bacterium]
MSRADFPELNRRHFLKHVAGLSALTLPGLQFVRGLRAAEPALKKDHKSVIILWMGGGPSHMDLWDLKPGTANGGEFKPIKTAASGVEISEVLPNVAKQMKHLSVIRSLVTNEGSHDRGTVLMNTGRMPSPIVQYPALGAVASSQLTPKDLPLPGFIGIGGTAQRIGPGFLGSLYSPFTVQNPGQPPQNIRPPDTLGSGAAAEARMRRRQRLFYAVEDSFTDSLYPHLPPSKEGKATEARKALGDAALSHETIYQKAFDLTVSKLRTIFEVSNEPKKVIDSYGGMGNQFGMGCLLARKLVEAGVTCVEVDLGGWDNHANVFGALKGTAQRPGLAGRLDVGMAALVRDLTDRGLWKNTVVLWMGEFGRTPRINQNAGRDHWARCWSVVVGGGAIKGGQVIGATSADGMDLADGTERVTIGDLFATVYKGIGLDPATPVRDNLGRPLKISDGKPVGGLV